MRLQKIPLRNTHAFSEFFLTYQEQHNSLKHFYGRFPVTDNFLPQLKEKGATFPASTRNILVETLQRQYKSLTPLPAAVEKNIQSLKEQTTFTVTTGHQLNVFTGPLYFIYKIVTVINACKRLKELYPAYHFVPVYWSATEDHDYEEIKSFRLYGKKYTWETKQAGAVGEFTTPDIKDILDQLPGDVSIFKKAYSKNPLLADAVRDYVNALFGPEGLIVVDANDVGLKSLLAPVMQADLFEGIPHKLVSDTNQRIQATGLTPPINPRDVNFFYLDKGLRGRLERTAHGFDVVDTPLKFSMSDVEKLIKSSPQKLSPNVILRPLYQEMILPNLAYVGGPAELVYWLELKDVFAHFGVPFPMLMPRNFALVVDAPTSRKLSKTGLDIQDFFENRNYLFNHWVSKNATHDLSLGPALKTVEKVLNDIQTQSTAIDATLGPMVKAEATRIQAALEKIEQKMLRAEKRLHSDRLRQIGDVKDQLFPNGGLQERVDNFLNFYQQDPTFIRQLLEHFDAFDFRFQVLTYE